MCNMFQGLKVKQELITHIFFGDNRIRTRMFLKGMLPIHMHVSILNYNIPHRGPFINYYL